MGIVKTVKRLLEIDYVTPDPNRVFGMDISHWAGGPVNFRVAKENGCQFVFIKATNNGYEVDWFRENWELARLAGVPRGAYAWLYPSRIKSANTQANQLYELLEELGHGELPPVVDFEKTWYDYEPANPDAKDLWGFLETYWRVSGVKPIIYTGPSYWDEHGTKETHWAEYMLWIANYDKDTPTVPLPWGSVGNPRWTFWQWTERGKGTDFGVDKYRKRAVDLNYFNGSISEFERVFESPPTIPYLPPPVFVPVEQPEGDNMAELHASTARHIATITWDKGANVRPQPHTNNTKIRTLGKGAVVEGYLCLDANEPDNELKLWLDIAGQGKEYVALLYPNNAGESKPRATFDPMENVPDTEDPGSEPSVKHVLTIYEDGDFDIDGVRYVPPAN